MTLIRTALVLLAILTGFLVGCADHKTADDLFRETLAAMEQAAQQRDTGNLMQYVSENYQDSQGRKKDDIRRIAQIHFLGNRKLHIYKHITQLELFDEQSARAIILVALAGQPIESAESLRNLRAELMQFKVAFEFNSGWKVTEAEWKRAGVGDFLQ